MKEGRGRLLEAGFALTLFAVVSLTSALWQKRTALNGGIGWDGCSYYSMAAQIQEGKWPQGPSPFIYRIGTPAFAALLGARDLLNGFLTANIIAVALLTILMLVWLRRHIDSWIVRLIMMAAFLFPCLCPTRLIYFYPTYVDPWGMVFCIAGLICIDKLRSRSFGWTLSLLCLICFLGPFFREFAALVGVAAVFSANLVSRERAPWFRFPRASFLLPCGSALLGAAVPASARYACGADPSGERLCGVLPAELFLPPECRLRHVFPAFGDVPPGLADRVWSDALSSDLRLAGVPAVFVGASIPACLPCRSRRLGMDRRDGYRTLRLVCDANHLRSRWPGHRTKCPRPEESAVDWISCDHSSHLRTVVLDDPGLLGRQFPKRHAYGYISARAFLALFGSVRQNLVSKPDEPLRAKTEHLLR